MVGVGDDALRDAVMARAAACQSDAAGTSRKARDRAARRTRATGAGRLSRYRAIGYAPSLLAREVPHTRRRIPWS